MDMGTKNINVRLPIDLEEDLEKFAEEHGYTSKSEVVRDAIRRLVKPKLSDRTLKDIEIARKQIREGKTVDHDELGGS
ncbi:MAG: Antitoxin (DNA-binding domain) of toxin-antitoxin stability system StbD [Candidatus Methanohalarchaeum thermophilum]|uniref:Antitoxin (DNA-binding domain) of toxin-antitoxin stability system StbD n=1 Tax=Methanohalarchaeum thermophilum TaxID=1903181 RepID=A0A1Q6DXT0_METT1|nr:MAG: Antitoxin (DNA-binding domain) of toxin-antitoxin stability system StbD [Candidatus Methanohalarchaeum thermophilum]